MSYSRALNYDKNYLVRDKESKIAIHDWVPQSLESKTKEFGELAVQSIIQAGKDLKIRCPLDGEYKIGNNWAETH